MIKIETPRGKVIQTKNGKARLVWNTGFQPKWQERFNNVQFFVDNEVLRLSAPYVPFRSGVLEKSGTLGTELGSGTVSYIAPYARYMYYGKLMVDPNTGSSFAPKGARKVLTEKNLNYNGAPKRGAFWFERMKADHIDAILLGARKIAGKG